MSDWVTHRNIDRFKRKIAEERDPEQRRVLEELLAKELLKLSDACDRAESLAKKH